MKGASDAVHLALARDEAVREALEHLHEHLVDRAEVVVDEALVGARLRGQPARGDPGVPDLDEQPLGRVEERLGGRAARRAGSGLDAASIVFSRSPKAYD